MKPAKLRNYVQARLEQELYRQASVELVMSGETWQGLITRLVRGWVRKKRAIERRKLETK